MRILEMKCTGCGGALEIAPEMETFTCGYCGSAQIIQRKGGTVILKPLTDSIAKVQAGTDRTAAELALARLKNELAEIDLKIANPLPTLPHDIAILKKDMLKGSTLTGSEILAMVLFVIAGFFLVFLLLMLKSLDGGDAGLFGIYLLGTITTLFLTGKKAFGRSRAIVKKDIDVYELALTGHVETLNEKRSSICTKIAEHQAQLS